MSKKPSTRIKKIGGDHDPEECNHKVNGQYIHHKQKKATDGKQLVELFNTDGKRELIVPNRNPVDTPVIMGVSEFERLKQQAHVVTLQDRMRMIEEAERKKNELQRESDLRKENLIKAQKQRYTAPGTKLDKTWLTADIENPMINIPGYVVYRQDRLAGRGGGVVIYVQNCNYIKQVKVISRTTLSDIDNLLIAVKICGKFVENEAADKNLYLLRRSKELMLEQDDRVKVANNVILASKCRAIRNAQIAEKELIEKQLGEENRRLDLMMEQQRQKLVHIEEKKREDAQKRKQKYVSEINFQMKENEMIRLLEAEKIEEESKMLNKALIELQKDEQENLRLKQERKVQMLNDFKKANEESEYYKQLRSEEQRIADLRIQAFMRKKQEREDELEKQKKLQKLAKEMEIARLKDQQEKGQDMQAALDELNALRWQEEKEKEWRRKEKQAAMKRIQMNKELRDARHQQIEDIRKSQAIALSRDEQDFLKVAQVQQELYDKHLEREKQKKEATSRHRKDLLKQINEKERERINWQREKFEDGRAQRMEYEVKDRNVEDYLRQKVNKLKQSNLPDQYIGDIERQLKLPK